MKTFLIKTLGCKVNQYDSQVIRESYLARGFKEADDGCHADACIINTCTVTGRADYKSRQLVRRFSRLNPKSRIVVTGCGRYNGQRSKKDFLFGVSGFSGHNRAFLKIQEGCNNFCAYCKVPLVRGRSYSRPKKDIMTEARRLIGAGFQELVLCGVCLGDYRGLPGLLAELKLLAGLGRLRLSSIEPAYVTGGLINELSSSGKFCRHLHIPLQSGDDEILKTMERGYTSKEFIRLIDYIRKRIKDAAITTDVLVGFPGETDRHFKNTIKAVKGISPSRTHIFAFSRRPGTKACSMPGQVSSSEKTERTERLKTVTQDASYAFRKGFEGKTLNILVEETPDRKTGLYGGYSDNYIRVLFPGAESRINRLTPVKIIRVLNDLTIGARVWPAAPREKMY